MATPANRIPSLEEAVAQLERDPAHAVHAQVDDLEVELRVVATANQPPTTSWRGGPWEGQTTEELIRAIHDARVRGESAGRTRP